MCIECDLIVIRRRSKGAMNDDDEFIREIIKFNHSSRCLLSQTATTFDRNSKAYYVLIIFMYLIAFSPIITPAVSLLPAAKPSK